MPSKNIIERALELAPLCASGKELRKKLGEEGYTQVDGHLGGLGMKRKLRKLYNQGKGSIQGEL